MNKLSLTLTAVMAFSAAAWADVVTERWGAGQQCRHADSADFSPAQGGGSIAKFDLSALPKGAKVYRARLLPGVKYGGFPLAEPIVIQPLTKPAGDDAPAVEDKALSLVPPRYASFDAADVVQRWASGKLANNGLLIRGAAANASRAFLEITYEGQLKDPPPPVTNLKAFHRAGQAFLTWTEINSKFAGQTEAIWKDFRDRFRDAKGETSYRVYRHTQPITARNLGQAELLDEVPQFSCFDPQMVQTEWKGEQIKNVKLDDDRVPRVAVEPKTELPPGTGVYVKTTTKGGDYFYAVISAVDGVENTTALGEGCATVQPIKHEVAPTEPVLMLEIPAQYAKERTIQCYFWYVDWPLSHVPSFVHVGVSAGPKVANPAPLVVGGYWWGSGWGVPFPCPQEEGLTLELDQHPWQMRGIHEGNGTLKAWSQGTIQNFYIRQVKALLPWTQAKYKADLDRVYAFSGGWAWHYPEVFAATFEMLTLNPKRSCAYSSADGRGPGEVQLYWRSVKNAPATEWGMNPYEYWDVGDWVSKNPSAELAHMSYTPYQHEGDFGRLDKPAAFAAMRDTKHAFATNFNESRGLYGTVDASWIFQIRKSDSIAAFTNCTLDDNPGIGAGGDPGGQINGWPAFDARSQADQPDKWEMTVYLLSPMKESPRTNAPLDACTADVTPRRCQKFKPKPGDKFTWANTSLAPGAEGPPVQTGQAVADANGLVTAENVIITKAKNRLVIQRAK